MSRLSELQAIVYDSDRSGCRDWVGARTPKGYGQVWDGTCVQLATHVALVLDGHPRPVGAIALHSCDRPVCVAPWHLRWGTHAENTQDMMSRGRGVAPIGLGNGKGKLTDEEVRAMRAMRTQGVMVKDIAVRFGVHRAHASRVTRGLRRGYVL